MKAAEEKTNRFFEEVNKLDQILKDLDEDAVACVAVPQEQAEIIIVQTNRDNVDNDIYEKDATPEMIAAREFENIIDNIQDLKVAISKFLSSVQAPQNVPLQHRGGNHDLFTSAFLSSLANHCPYPFTPVKTDNWRDFARLAAAGWEDLGLPRLHRSSKSYPTVYGWLSDRIRTQFGFRQVWKDKKNPKQT